MASKEKLKETFVKDAVPTEDDFHDLIDLAGDIGRDGAKGDKGDKGSPGKDGKDGFPTEEQWNDLVARVEALEG